MELYESFNVVVPVQPINPVVLTAVAVSNSQINLTVSWSGGSLQGIFVYWSSSVAGPWAVLTSFSTNTGSFSHMGLSAGIPYYYETYAIAGGVVSPMRYATATTSGSSLLIITSGSMPSAVVGTSYAFTPTASGGVAPFFWDIDSATPNSDSWLSLLNGQIVGTPQTAETESVILRVSDSAPTQSSTTATFSFAVNDSAVVPAHQVKWNPGHYSASNQVVKTTDNRWPSRRTEIDLTLQNANVLGYYDFHNWNTIENATLGVYDFTNIDQARDYIQTNYPGKRYGVVILFESFSNTTPSGVIPTYVQNDASYGASPDGVTFGWWSLGTTGSTSAWWRSAVAARVQALFAALAAHQSAGQASAGYANYDADPFFEMVSWDESSASLAGGSDATSSNSTTQWIAINRSLVSSFPHTSVVSQNNFLLGTQANTETTVHTEAGNRLAIGGPDVFGASGAPGNLTWGQRGYIGLDGFTDLRGSAPYIAFVQTPDYSYTVADIGAAALGSTGNGLQATHVWWTIVIGGNGNFDTEVLPFINTNPVTNTAYPRTYP